MNIETAREVAARIWCDQEMGNVEMDTDLAEIIAQALVVASKKPRELKLGLATTRELLAEISARFEVQCRGGLNYRP